jgi:hypothetical protein
MAGVMRPEGTHATEPDDEDDSGHWIRWSGCCGMSAQSAVRILSRRAPGGFVDLELDLSRLSHLQDRPPPVPGFPGLIRQNSPSPSTTGDEEAPPFRPPSVTTDLSCLL